LDGGGFLCYDTLAFKGKLEAIPLMNYSGNSSLSSEVKQRILSTFEQTLELARGGSRQEALLGCDFVLRMDPRFEPARVLQERLRTSTGPVAVQDLLQTGSAIVDPFADLDSLSLDLPDLLPASLPGLPGLPGIDGALRNEFQSLLDQRRFQDLMIRAQQSSAAIAADPELQRILGMAQERMEAEPYVVKFLDSARQALQAGQTDEVGRLLDKARSLDASHPGIAEVEHARGASPVAHWTASGPVAPAPPEPLPERVIPPPLQTSAMPTSLAFGGGDSESDRRIRELLDEGQVALDAGDPQGAIDAWSRIFLIDIDHQEASRRIEAARKLKAEAERQVEEIFHDGLGHLEAGDLAEARQAFERVLAIQPGYFAAREYLQQLDAGNVPRPRPAGTRETTRESTRETYAEPQPLPVATALPAAGRDLKEEILVPPEPPDEARPERRPVRKTPAARRDPKRARRLFLWVGGIVLLIALAAIWFLFQKKDQFFPNSKPEATATPATPASDPIARAQRLNKAGKTDRALSLLRRIQPNEPHYAEAQKLIAQWGGAAGAGGAAGSPEPGATPAEAAGTPGVAGTPGSPASGIAQESQDKRSELLAEARQAYAERAYLKTLNKLDAAGSIAKLDGDDARLFADTKQKLASLERVIDLFHQHEWELVAREMWTKHEAEPANRDVTQLLADSYYDMAVRDLQRNDAPKAAEKLKQVLEFQDDPVVRRHLQFAQTYQDRNKDLLYRIYVKYLPYR
jgi:tetratricopeptide (TPR) repeat protein